jgi:hypothetical protein
LEPEWGRRQTRPPQRHPRCPRRRRGRRVRACARRLGKDTRWGWRARGATNTGTRAVPTHPSRVPRRRRRPPTLRCARKSDDCFQRHVIFSTLSFSLARCAPRLQPDVPCHRDVRRARPHSYRTRQIHQTFPNPPPPKRSVFDIGGFGNGGDHE